MRSFLSTIALLIAAATATAADTRPPNIVILFADDMAYSDPACFGSKANDTPRLDRMAKEGRKFTSFYVTTAVCSASRAALMTGSYPLRVGITGVLGPASNIGLNPGETTLAEIARQRDYATACFGKWHLGYQTQFLPMSQGFDEFWGTPYSHDMWPFHPHSQTYPDLPLIEGDTTIQINPNPAILTTQCAERAVKFIDRNKDKSFLLYLPFNLPHVPMGVSTTFKGKSRNGIYGDVMMEIDWAVGLVLDKLKEHKLDGNTLVIFTSDNGPWEPYGNHAGNKEPLRGAKASTWEGGMRVPMIAWWPGTIPAGTTCDEVAATIDVLPTMAKLIGAQVPTDRVIDGRDIGPLLRGEAGAKSPHEALFYCKGNTIEAVRSGPWKLILQVSEAKDKPVQIKPTALYHLETDISEQKNVAAQQPEIVKKMSEQARMFVEQLRASSRPAGRVN